MRILVVLLALAIGFGAGYVTWGNKPGNPKVTQPKVQAAVKEPAITPASGYSLQPASYDFGKLLEGEHGTKTLLLQRPAGAAIRLGRLYSPCPCIFVRADKLNFAADEKILITVNVHSLSLQGKKSFPVYVEIVNPIKQILRADISINVLRVPARMLIKPSALHLGTIHGSKTASITLYNLTAHPVKLKTVTSSLPQVKTDITSGQRIPAGESQKINLAIQSLAKGMVKGELIIETDCNEHLKMSVPMDGTSLP